MKINWKLLMLLALFGLFLISGCTKSVNNANIPPEKYCVEDSDCLRVKDGCCNCNMGGKTTVINKEYRSQWEADLLEQCKGMDCLAVISDDWTCTATPKCIDNECALK